MSRAVKPSCSRSAAILAALVAFAAEHRRCGELHGGRYDRYVWLACSCGGRMMHPVREAGP